MTASQMLRSEKVFILRAVKYGEADLIVTGLDSVGSKHTFLARAALRSRKRFGGGVLEPTHYVNITFDDKAQLRPGGLNTLKEAQLLEEFPGIRLSYERLNTALEITAMVSSLAREGVDDHESLFNLYGNTLRVLAKGRRSVKPEASAKDWVPSSSLPEMMASPGVLASSGEAGVSAGSVSQASSVSSAASVPAAGSVPPVISAASATTEAARCDLIWVAFVAKLLSSQGVLPGERQFLELVKFPMSEIESISTANLSLSSLRRDLRAQLEEYLGKKLDGF
jgi:Recombination protein O N terminal